MLKGKEILIVAEAIANEKNIEEQLVLQAIEQGLARAIKKHFDNTLEIEVSIDPETGEYTTFSIQKVIDSNFFEEQEEEQEPYNKNYHLYVDEAEKKGDYKVDDIIRTPIPNIPQTRISAQHARTAILQKIKEAENEKIAESFKDRIGEVITCLGTRMQRGDLIVEISDNIEGVIPKNKLIPGEVIKFNTRIKACIHEVHYDKGHCQITLSRTSKEFLAGLFAIEVPEIYEGLIQIKAIGREAGFRSKVMVTTINPRLDAIGSCIGMRGSRIQVISKELNNERIDVLEYSEDPIQCIINALAPAEPISMNVDSENQSIDVILSEEQLPIAIGKNGHNVRLARQLSGWEIHLFSDQQEPENTPDQKQTQELIDQLELEQDALTKIQESNIQDLEQFAELSVSEIANIFQIEESEAEQLSEKAQTILLQQAFEDDRESLESIRDELLSEGLTETQFQTLMNAGLTTIESLADLSIDELQEHIDLNNEAAGKIIMYARSKQN